MLTFQWDTMTDFAKMVLYKLGAMPSREFEARLKEKEEEITFTKKYYEKKVHYEFNQKYNKLTVQLHKLFSIQEVHPESHIADFRLDYTDSHIPIDLLSDRPESYSASISFLNVPITFSFSEKQRQFINHKDCMEFKGELADFITEELFDRHIPSIRANIKKQVEEFLTQIEDKVNGVGTR